MAGVAATGWGGGAVLNFLTDFADQAVVLPVAASVLAVLLACRWWRGALAWVAAVGGVLAAMLLLKLMVLACGWRFGWTGISSPSGHTATAAVVYGGLAALLAPRVVHGAWRAAAVGAGVALVIGATRVRLGVHTPADVAVGALVGMAGAAALGRLAGAPRRSGIRPYLLVAPCVMILLFHGQRLQAEAGIRWLALDVWPMSLCRRG